MPISFESACGKNEVEFVNRALFSATPNVPTEVRNTKSWSGLMIASSKGALEVCKIFVENKCDLEAKDPLGRTALFLAAKNGFIDVVKYLVDNKANIKTSQNQGWTLLHAGAENGHFEIVKFLVENGADKEIQVYRETYFSNSTCQQTPKS
jgi:ankyrin repeat protein